MKTEIVKTENENEGQTPTQLLALAVKQNIDIDKLEKLMGMQERWQAQQSRKKFFAAISEFQFSVPKLEKKKQVKFGNTCYKYAELGEISETIKDTLRAVGLSYRWEMEDVEAKQKCTCIVTHVDGYSERSSMTAGQDKSGNKNDIQSIASSITYLQRYTLIGALGLTTANEDTDAQPVKEIVKEAISGNGSTGTAETKGNGGRTATVPASSQKRSAEKDFGFDLIDKGLAYLNSCTTGSEAQASLPKAIDTLRQRGASQEIISDFMAQATKLIEAKKNDNLHQQKIKEANELKEKLTSKK